MPTTTTIHCFNQSLGHPRFVELCLACRKLSEFLISDGSRRVVRFDGERTISGITFPTYTDRHRYPYGCDDPTTNGDDRLPLYSNLLIEG